jgi:hypothetical protein
MHVESTSDANLEEHSLMPFIVPLMSSQMSGAEEAAAISAVIQASGFF